MSDFTFTLVRISHGRKFRGEAYFLGQTETRNFSPYRSCYRSYESTRLWDPAAMRFVYANPEFCEDIPVDETKLAADKAAYIKHVIDGTIQWCKSQKPTADEAEVNRFARNVLKKHHPEMQDDIDARLPDQRDPASEIQRTLEWAMKLTTRPCRMYGRWCAGGKPISPERKVQAAYHALEKRGITKLDCFAEAWKFFLADFGLPNAV